MRLINVKLRMQRWIKVIPTREVRPTGKNVIYRVGIQ